MWADDMRPGASSHIGLCWNGNCNDTTGLRACVYVINLHWHSISWLLIKSMMQVYFGMSLLEMRPSKNGYVLQLPNRCGETAELESRELIINTPPHLSRHSKRNS